MPCRPNCNRSSQQVFLFIFRREKGSKNEPGTDVQCHAERNRDLSDKCGKSDSRSLGIESTHVLRQWDTRPEIDTPSAFGLPGFDSEWIVDCHGLNS